MTLAHKRGLVDLSIVWIITEVNKLHDTANFILHAISR